MKLDSLWPYFAFRERGPSGVVAACLSTRLRAVAKQPPISMLRITAHLNLLRQIPVRCPSPEARVDESPLSSRPLRPFSSFRLCSPCFPPLRSPSRGPSALWGGVILAATFRVAQHKRHDPGFWSQPGQEEVKSEHVCVRPPAGAISRFRLICAKCALLQRRAQVRPYLHCALGRESQSLAHHGQDSGGQITNHDPCCQSLSPIRAARQGTRGKSPSRC